MDRRTTTEIEVAKDLIHTAADKTLDVVGVAEEKAVKVLELGEQVKEEAEKRASQITQQLFDVVHSISSDQKEIRKILEGQNEASDRSFDTFNTHVEADLVWQNGMQKSFDELNIRYANNGKEWKASAEQTKQFKELLEGHMAKDVAWKESLTIKLDNLTTDTAGVVMFLKNAKGFAWIVNWVKTNFLVVAIILGLFYYLMEKTL